jgi:adenylyl-sulfate kinase
MHFDRQLFKPAVIWLTGLSGSGKTTIACSLADIFRIHHIMPVLLDGDEIRQAMQVQGYGESARRKHNLHVGYLSALLEKQGHVVIVSLISPYADVRHAIQLMCSNFIEVHIATELATCIQRDPKGLYKKAIAGEIKDFTGVSAPYEAPVKPEVRIDTEGRAVEDCSKAIFEYYRSK